MKRILILFAVVLSTACQQPGAPLVGITCSRSSSGSTLLSTNYTEAVARAGGVPVVIPTVSTPGEAEAIVAKLDGILFSGGEDVDPAWYGEAELNETVKIDSVRDRSDSLLARAALASGKPVMGICRGEQLLDVIMGGSLYQDIPSQIPETVGHGGGARHKIGVEPGSVLERLFGPDSLTVNSHHHQAVKAAAPGIRVTARSAEGVVEAYEAEHVLAVQFHPEKMLRDGEDKWLALFEYYVNSCIDQ